MIRAFLFAPSNRVLRILLTDTCNLSQEIGVRAPHLIKFAHDDRAQRRDKYSVG